jgi:hypothetical protein
MSLVLLRHLRGRCARPLPDAVSRLIPNRRSNTRRNAPPQVKLPETSLWRRPHAHTPPASFKALTAAVVTDGARRSPGRRARRTPSWWWDSRFHGLRGLHMSRQDDSSLMRYTHRGVHLTKPANTPKLPPTPMRRVSRSMAWLRACARSPWRSRRRARVRQHRF